ncbi:MAG: D-alanyl-D-alanine carboxypeptidase family protein [Clostridia bacterium]
MKKLSIILVSIICSCAVFVFCSQKIYASSDVCVSSAQSAVLMEASTGRILYAKNIDKKLYMASTTKIVTAITVLDNISDVNAVVTVPKEAQGVEGSSIYLVAGEHLTVLELLYGLMLQSGNDCAVTLAIKVAGSVKAFANLMNKTAHKVGAQNSNFVTPHGLHDNNHYTTAYDLGLITAYALKNETFRKIVSTKSITIANETKEYRRLIQNKNKLLKNYEFANGVKTGFTSKAGRCFVGSAYKDGMQLIAVVLNCVPMFEESEAMLKYGFNHYKLRTIIPDNKVCGALIRNNKMIFYKVNEGFSYPIKDGSDELDKIKKEITLPYKNDIDGNLSVYLDKQLIYFQKLVTM